MKAMVFHSDRPAMEPPLAGEEVDTPVPRDDEILVRVDKCGVCRTDLHIVDRDLPSLRPTIIPGHEIVGEVSDVGESVRSFNRGDVAGIPWLHRTCGHCEYCTTGRENLCEIKVFTGYSVDGGYAEYATALEAYAFPLPPGDRAAQAPLLCAGIIGYRALKVALPRPGGRIGFFGFGGSAHLALQLAAKLGYQTVAYTRNQAHYDLAQRLGASEVVLSQENRSSYPHPTLDAAVVFAPAGEVVLQALHELKKGGTLSIAAIHMSPIPAIDYDRLLFGERRIVSVEANTRDDAREFLELADRFGIQSTVSVLPLTSANDALTELRTGRVSGALVLDCQ